jgi:formamidopyrimidine-DNA glycosylase
MRSQVSSTGESGAEARSHVRRKARPCLGCGTPVVRAGHEPGTGLFCAACVDRPDDPVTAEHYWDLGGNE